MNKSVLLIIVVLFLLMMFFNKKVCLIQLFIRQIKVLKNDRTNKISIWDLMCFIIFPIAISALIVFGLHYQIDKDLANTLTTVFSLVFTILFGFSAVIMERSASENTKRKQVIGETFISIVTSTVLSLFAAVISIVLTKINNGLTTSILSFTKFTLSFANFMLLLMITKRTFIIYCDSE